MRIVEVSRDVSFELVYDPRNTSVQYQYQMRVVPGTFEKK